MDVRQLLSLFQEELLVGLKEMGDGARTIPVGVVDDDWGGTIFSKGWTGETHVPSRILEQHAVCLDT